MVVESYTLREVAEVLGVSKRTLQRRIQEGAFPGRYLAAGRHGLETRIPADDVQRALEDLKRRGQSAVWRSEADDDGARTPTVTPTREFESLVPYQTPEIAPAAHSSNSANASALTTSDLESLRDAMLAIVREDREVFLTAIRDALLMRDREIVGLKQELTGIRRVIETVRSGLESIERRMSLRKDANQTIDAQVWADMLAGSSNVGRSTVDVDSLLREIGELESMLVAVESE